MPRIRSGRPDVPPFDALSKSSNHGVVFLTAASGNWTVPTGVTSVQVECIGPGGNGWLDTTTGGNKPGGGDGGYSKKNVLSVTSGANIPYQVG